MDSKSTIIINNAMIILLFVFLALHSSFDEFGISYQHDPAAALICSPRSRRLLASIPDRQGQTKQWRSMARCTVNQLAYRKSHLFLHTSKSGGTSMCQLFKEEGCYDGKSNCQIKTLDTGPSWVRSETVKGFGLPRWMTYRQNTLYPITCEGIHSFLAVDNDTRLIALEQFLPNMTACRNSVLTSIIVREPIDRILSHYKEILKHCTLNCETAFSSQTSLFNMTTMAREFDIVTDNYLLRSLGGSTAFGLPFGSMSSNGNMLNNALDAFRDIDWIMILPRKTDEGDVNNSMILERGLGFTNNMPHQRSSSDNHTLAGEDAKWLRELNQPDYLIWREAQKLHSLDVLSFRKMDEFAPDILWECYNVPLDIKRKYCWGNVCRSFPSS